MVNNPLKKNKIDAQPVRKFSSKIAQELDQRLKFKNMFATLGAVITAKLTAVFFSYDMNGILNFNQPGNIHLNIIFLVFILCILGGVYIFLWPREEHLSDLQDTYKTEKLIRRPTTTKNMILQAQRELLQEVVNTKDLVEAMNGIDNPYVKPKHSLVKQDEKIVIDDKMDINGKRMITIPAPTTREDENILGIIEEIDYEIDQQTKHFFPNESEKHNKRMIQR